MLDGFEAVLSPAVWTRDRDVGVAETKDGEVLGRDHAVTANMTYEFRTFINLL